MSATERERLVAEIAAEVERHTADPVRFRAWLAEQPDERLQFFHRNLFEGGAR